MCRKCIVVLSVLLMLVGAAYSSNQVTLKHGMNEVAVKVFNECNVDLESLSLSMKTEDLPEGITAAIGSHKISVSSKKQSENGLLISIEVAGNVEEGVYSIPFSLTDGAHNKWDFVLAASVVSNIPDRYELAHNFPNPFNPTTHIRYALACKQDQETRLVVFNSLGKQVRTLVNEKQSAGTYSIAWDGRDDAGNRVSSGIYFYKLTSGSFSQMRKMMLLK